MEATIYCIQNAASISVDRTQMSTGAVDPVSIRGLVDLVFLNRFLQ